MKYKMAADQVLKRFARQIRKEDASRRAKAKAHLTGNMAQTRRLCLISRIHHDLFFPGKTKHRPRKNTLFLLSFSP